MDDQSPARFQRAILFERCSEMLQSCCGRPRIAAALYFYSRIPVQMPAARNSETIAAVCFYAGQEELA